MNGRLQRIEFSNPTRIINQRITWLALEFPHLTHEDAVISGRILAEGLAHKMGQRPCDNRNITAPCEVDVPPMGSTGELTAKGGLLLVQNAYAIPGRRIQKLMHAGVLAHAYENKRG